MQKLKYLQFKSTNTFWFFANNFIINFLFLPFKNYWAYRGRNYIPLQKKNEGMLNKLFKFLGRRQRRNFLKIRKFVVRKSGAGYRKTYVLPIGHSIYPFDVGGMLAVKLLIPEDSKRNLLVPGFVKLRQEGQKLFCQFHRRSEVWERAFFTRSLKDWLAGADAREFFRCRIILGPLGLKACLSGNKRTLLVSLGSPISAKLRVPKTVKVFVSKRELVLEGYNVADVEIFSDRICKMKPKKKIVGNLPSSYRRCQRSPKVRSRNSPRD
jgi:hypothetical protein